jgi:hypothetical protein
LAASRADIAIYSGSAGAGKAYGLLFEGGRYLPRTPGFNGHDRTPLLRTPFRDLLSCGP